MTLPQQLETHAGINPLVVRAHLQVERDNINVAAFGSRLLRREVGFAADALDRADKLDRIVAPLHLNFVADGEVVYFGLLDFEVNPVVCPVLQRVKRHTRRDERTFLDVFVGDNSVERRMNFVSCKFKFASSVPSALCEAIMTC